MKNFLFLILLLAGCDKEFIEPAKTDNERFYCEIDGKIFRPRNNGDLFDSVLYTESYLIDGRKEIAVLAFNKIQNYSSITIGLDFKSSGLVTGKIDTQNSKTNANYVAGYISSLSKSDLYKGENLNINISKLDTMNRKISGKFEFDGRSVIDPTKIKKIRNGEFNNLSY